jgi:hypothetical protein
MLLYHSMQPPLGCVANWADFRHLSIFNLFDFISSLGQCHRSQNSEEPAKKLQCRVRVENIEGKIRGKEGRRDKIQRHLIETKRLRTTYRDTMGTIPRRHQMRSCVGGCPDLKLTRAVGESGKESRNGQNGRGVTTVIAITGQD